MLCLRQTLCLAKIHINLKIYKIFSLKMKFFIFNLYQYKNIKPNGGAAGNHTPVHKKTSHPSTSLDCLITGQLIKTDKYCW